MTASRICLGNMIHITHHAFTRYRERVNPKLSNAEIVRLIDTPRIRRAVEFGASIVRLGCGARLVIEEFNVVTVLPRENYTQHILRQGLGRYGRSPRSPYARNAKHDRA